MEKGFYNFLQPISQEFVHTLQELEHAIYNSPRSMLTHSRTFIEALLEKVMIHEHMDNEPYLTIMERIQDVDENGLLTEEVKNALHEVRKLGNIASHDTRQFRFSESLTAWEHLYTILKWFVEVYGSHTIDVPEYVDPVMKRDSAYGLEEMNIRFKQIEELLQQSIQQEQPKEIADSAETPVEEIEEQAEPCTAESIDTFTTSMDIEPGLFPVRTITYGDESIDVPYFLRDAFLLPQRFETSERFLIRMGGEQEARLMSELPNRLEGFHERVTRYNASHTETFFHELREFIQEETRRRQLVQNRPGELFLFYEMSEIIVTEDLGEIEINKINFTGFPGLIDQLNKDGVVKVSDLPKELVIIGKYQGVGKTRVESFFSQLKEKQRAKIAELV